jgi:hypothetical protein
MAQFEKSLIDDGSSSDTPPQTAYDNIDYLRKLVDEMSELVH